MDDEHVLTIEEALAHVRLMARLLEGKDKAALELLCRVSERSRRASSASIPAAKGVGATSGEHFAKARAEIERGREASLAPAEAVRRPRTSRPPKK